MRQNSCGCLFTGLRDSVSDEAMSSIRTLGIHNTGLDSSPTCLQVGQEGGMLSHAHYFLTTRFNLNTNPSFYLASATIAGSAADECWYALKTYNAQEFKQSAFLKKYGIEHFIPTIDSSYYTIDGEFVKNIRPVVHNLIFIRKTISKAELKSILTISPYPSRIYHHIGNEAAWCEISDKELMELRLICDNTFSNPQFLSEEECEMKEGVKVRIRNGPFKGITGKLVRKSKKYYLVKSFVGLGVEICISRWCCEKIKDEEKLT